MELRVPHMLHLFNIFRENDRKENCAQVLEEECIKMFGTKYLNDEHDCNVVSMNSLNIHSTNDDCISYDENASYKHVNFCGVHWVCKYTPNREDRYYKRHKYLEIKLLQEELDECAKIFNIFRAPCEVCNEHGHLNLQCYLFHYQVVSKYCDNLITLEHHKELSLLLGYEEMKRITEGIPKFNLDRFLDFDLEKIYMYCAVSCIENPYIANYIKKRKQIEDEDNANEREETSQYSPIISYDESGNEEEPSIQPISLIRSSKKRIEPTHDVVKKKKRKMKRGKKVSLPNKVAPIIVVPHENEDDTLDDDLVMPIACCDDYDWEDNDTPYDLENLFGTCLEEYDNCYTIGAIYTINDKSDYAYDKKRPKLGEAMFDEDDVFENIFAAIIVCPKLGDATFNEDDIFSLPCFDMQSDYDENKVATYDDYCDKTYAIKSSDDYIYKTCHDYEYPFSEHYVGGNRPPRTPMGTEPLLDSAGGEGCAKSGSRRHT